MQKLKNFRWRDFVARHFIIKYTNIIKHAIHKPFGIHDSLLLDFSAFRENRSFSWFYNYTRE